MNQVSFFKQHSLLHTSNNLFNGKYCNALAYVRLTNKFKWDKLWIGYKWDGLYEQFNVSIQMNVSVRHNFHIWKLSKNIVETKWKASFITVTTIVFILLPIQYTRLIPKIQTINKNNSYIQKYPYRNRTTHHLKENLIIIANKTVPCTVIYMDKRQWSRHNIAELQLFYVRKNSANSWHGKAHRA